VTDRRTDGQTEFSSLYRVCITCSAVKTFFKMHKWMCSVVKNAHSSFSVAQYYGPLSHFEVTCRGWRWRHLLRESGASTCADIERDVRRCIDGDLRWSVFVETHAFYSKMATTAVSWPTCWKLLPSSLKSPSLKPAHFCKQLKTIVVPHVRNALYFRRKVRAL